MGDCRQNKGIAIIPTKEAIPPSPTDERIAATTPRISSPLTQTEDHFHEDPLDNYLDHRLNSDYDHCASFLAVQPVPLLWGEDRAEVR
jgi:hypothetical protein